MTKEIIIDESNATEFNYTLKSIDKVVGCKFVKESYTPKEICELLKQFCMVLDLKILEAKGGIMTEEIIINEKSLQAVLKRCDELEQENKELKEMYRLSCLKCEYKNTKADVDKYRSAFEEIKTVLKFYADTWVDEKIYPNLHYDNTKAKEGLSKINEVLQ